MSIQKSFGRIKKCSKYIQKCQYKCCIFHDNYIALYPGEWERTKLFKSHITIIDEDYFGGKKAICSKNLGCNSNIDFQPLDCKTYPYFPKIDEQGDIKILKGQKCPLIKRDLIHHKILFMKTWKPLIKNKTIFNWLKKIKLIGYEIEREDYVKEKF